MLKKVTITMDGNIYDGLCRVAGRRKISEFIESLVRPYVLENEISEGYQQMAADQDREAEASEWIEGTAMDIVDETG